MEHKIINTGNYLLIVDDSEIKVGDFYYEHTQINPDRFEIFKRSVDIESIENSKKVIAHLPLNNSPILKVIDLLPPIEYEVEKLAKEYANSKSSSEIFRDAHQKDFTAGYDKHAERYRYTKEDMVKFAIHYRNNVSGGSLIQNMLNDFLQQPKMPVGFSTLEQWYNPKTNKAGYSLPEVTGLNDNDGCYMIHSIITNSQGLTQWVGEYIY